MNTDPCARLITFMMLKMTVSPAASRNSRIPNWIPFRIWVAMTMPSICARRSQDERQPLQCAVAIDQQNLLLGDLPRVAAAAEAEMTGTREQALLAQPLLAPVAVAQLGHQEVRA